MSRTPATIVDLSADRQNALAMFDVSRETITRLDRFVDLLLASTLRRMPGRVGRGAFGLTLVPEVGFREL